MCLTDHSTIDASSPAAAGEDAQQPPPAARSGADAEAREGASAAPALATTPRATDMVPNSQRQPAIVFLKAISQSQPEQRISQDSIDKRIRAGQAGALALEKADVLQQPQSSSSSRFAATREALWWRKAISKALELYDPSSKEASLSFAVPLECEKFEWRTVPTTGAQILKRPDRECYLMAGRKVFIVDFNKPPVQRMLFTSQMGGVPCANQECAGATDADGNRYWDTEPVKQSTAKWLHNFSAPKAVLSCDGIADPMTSA